MDPGALHLEVRNAIVLADDLGRHEHAAGDDELVARLAALRTTLGELERALGRGHEAAGTDGDLLARLSGQYERLRLGRQRVTAPIRLRMEKLLGTLDRIVFA